MIHIEGKILKLYAQMTDYRAKLRLETRVSSMFSNFKHSCFLDEGLAALPLLKTCHKESYFLSITLEIPIVYPKNRTWSIP